MSGDSQKFRELPNVSSSFRNSYGPKTIGPHRKPYKTFILIELIPLCLNSKSKTKCLKVTIKTQQRVKMLVFYCGNMFRSCWTIFNPTFRAMRYNRCISCTVGSHITCNVCIKIVLKYNITHIYLKWPKST